MAEIFIPTLHTFAMNNVFTGSCGALRFKITPIVCKKEGSKEVDFDASSIEVEFWHGLFCYEKSQIESKKVFRMTDSGRQEILDWLYANV